MITALRRWLHSRRAPDRYAQLDRLLGNAGLSAEALRLQQQRSFTDLVRFAASHTDYYARRLGDLSAWDGTSTTLPILTKAEIRSHLDEMRVRGPAGRHAKQGHTGGSTGQPLAFWYDEAKHELMRAGMMRGFMMSGWRPGQKVLYLWGARQDVGKGGVFGQRITDAIAGERTIAAVEYSEATMHAWAMQIRRWRPTLIYGYASALSELARYISDEGLAMPGSLIGIYSTAEVLQDEQRALMQQAFGCQVFNQYGCREVPNIAWECRQGGMHVMSDLVALESVALEGEDRLLVTSLTDRLMPFIRYELGDTGRLLAGECGCGAPFPLMEMGVCRRNDLILTASGRRIHPAVLNRQLYGLTQIHAYQWVQRDPVRLELNLVCQAPLVSEVVARIEAGVRREVDAAMQLDIHYVPEIPRTQSGKHRFVIGLG